jgi:hypothetical protein
LEAVHKAKAIGVGLYCALAQLDDLLWGPFLIHAATSGGCVHHAERIRSPEETVLSVLATCYHEPRAPPLISGKVLHDVDELNRPDEDSDREEQPAGQGKKMLSVTWNPSEEDPSEEDPAVCGGGSVGDVGRERIAPTLRER